VREGLRAVLCAVRDFRILGEIADGAKVLNVLANKNADVLILDLSLPGADGIEILRSLRAKGGSPSILVYTMYPEEELGVRTIQCGASGYLTKNRPADELINAVRTVASGKKYISE